MNSRAFLETVRPVPAIRDFLDCVKNGRRAAVYDTCDGQRALLTALAALDEDRCVLLITSSAARAQRLQGDISAILGEEERCGLLTAREQLFLRGTAGREGLTDTLRVLREMREGRCRVLVCAADAVMAPLWPRDAFSSHALSFRSGDRYELKAVLDALIRMGYERAPMAEGPGQFAQRGDILDVFPGEGGSPLRLEFFDDELDLIRTFDPLSQRSLEKNLSEVTVYPAFPFLLPGDAAREMTKKVRAAFDRRKEARPEENPASWGIFQELERCRTFEETGVYPGDAGKWAAFAGQERAFIWEQFRTDPVILLDESQHITERWQDRENGFMEDLKSSLDRGDALPEWQGAQFTCGEVKKALDQRPAILLEGLLRGLGGFAPKTLIGFAGRNAPKYYGRMDELTRDIRAYRQRGARVWFCAAGGSRRDRIRNALSPFNIEITEDDILPWNLSQGFSFGEDTLFLTGGDMFGAGTGTSSGRKKTARKTLTRKLEAFTDLTEGDYVVHENFGIGVFEGTVRLQSDGVWRDYFYIRYQGTDRLYVPIDQFERVQKYLSGDSEEAPQLDSLNSTKWLKTQKKVRAGLKQLAFDLVQLYARRQAAPGYAFQKDTPWQAEFEDAFPHELTADQEQAVAEIKEDMEKPVNMDRLLCGDVGFGKTEVALRAAFKCVMSGKQAALLCPTTVLCQQHFYTVQNRFKDFPVRVESLSRFRTAAESRRVLNALKNGDVDIVVGTHRLLGKDVVFKDLGLLIVDEEQRFGVSHKEKIKDYKTEVDVLTLSATPIPRTLHMSMIGVRDMSVLSTPPEERFPVQTYVMEYSDSVIRDALAREIARGGQAYFLYNRVESIERFADRLRTLLPEARIGVAHGQMEEKRLENVMMDFYDGELDVLLCSTIIENGLDVPRANTLVVYEADRFGLSQLYQLRGRVGRSSRTAFAYFTVRPDKSLSETAEKRLDAIRDFTAFGSGFRIAMRDLEIRGSGNIFGPEQSGNVAAVGYDLYCKMIQDAVSELMPGSTAARRVATRMELKMDAFLPADYVSGEHQRMEIFRKIAAITGREDREDLLDEMIDRYGNVPDSVVNLVNVAHLKAVCSSLGISRVSGARGLLTMQLEICDDPEKWYLAMNETDRRLTFSAGKTVGVLFREQDKDIASLTRDAIPVMEKLAERFRRDDQTEKKDEVRHE